MLCRQIDVRTNDGRRLGLRREAARLVVAQRRRECHAAFGRKKNFRLQKKLRVSESGVAAPALPPQSKIPSDLRAFSNSHVFFETVLKHNFYSLGALGKQQRADGPSALRQLIRSATWYLNIRFFIQRTASKS